MFCSIYYETYHIPPILIFYVTIIDRNDHLWIHQLHYLSFLFIIWFLFRPIPNMWSCLCYLLKVAHWPTICFATFAERCLIHISVSIYKRNMQMNPTFISVDFNYIKTLHILYAIKMIILFWHLILYLWRFIVLEN